MNWPFRFCSRLRHFVNTLIVLVASSSHASPPAEPILRIEPGSHIASISQIAVDASGRYLVTASADKTSHVWDVAQGRLVRVLRPPYGHGRDGILAAVAITPDGALVALGGATTAGFDGAGVNNIFLMNRVTGNVVRRLDGLQSAIASLSFSPDGRYLAAGLAGDSGLRIWRCDSWELIGEDKEYQDHIFGVDFSRDGRLVTSSYDGSIRLYSLGGRKLRLLQKKTVLGGKLPHAVRFAPNGRYVAVGFTDRATVNVLNGQTLAVLFVPDAPQVTYGNLAAVAWSADGQTLYAGGRYNFGGRFQVLQWPREGRGLAKETTASTNTLTDLRTMPGGGIAFGTQDPAWGVLDRQGIRSRFFPGPLADYRDIQSGFLLSADGRSVRFGFEYGGRSPARFDLDSGFSVGDSASVFFTQPRINVPGLEIVGWNSTSNPTLNGLPLALDPHEMSRSLDISADGKRFALGANWSIRLFDKAGKQQWVAPTPGVAWGVRLSTDGQLVVAALGDGTIRWYDAETGRQRLAFFPHSDRQRWVAWTPTGYYWASLGGEDLIGWHLNNGIDAAADFFPAARFRSIYNRPDIVARALSPSTEIDALRRTNQDTGRVADAPTTPIRLLVPPVVSIHSPADGSSVSTTYVVLNYSVRTTTDAPVTALRARVNGRRVRVEPIGADQVRLEVPTQDAEINLFAENRNGVSVPAVLRLKWVGTKQEPKHDVATKPKLYLLAIGVSKYANRTYDLGLAAKDAIDLADVFLGQKGRLYGDVTIRLLTDAKATKDEVLGGLDWLKREVTSRDVGIMFLAGHGINDNTGKYFFLPHNGDPEQLLRTGVPQTDIRDTLNTLAGKAIFFVDTCHSGNALGTARTRSFAASTDAFVNELAAAENGVVVFTAATGRQVSLEDEAWGNGAFTKAVVEGLSGMADFQKSGRITHTGLNYYVAERVKELTKGAQSPTSIVPQGIPDFPLAIAPK